MKYLNIFGKIQTIVIEFEVIFTQHEIKKKNKRKLLIQKTNVQKTKVIKIIHSFAKNAMNSIYIVRILTQYFNKNFVGRVSREGDSLEWLKRRNYFLLWGNDLYALKKSKIRKYYINIFWDRDKYQMNELKIHL